MSCVVSLAGLALIKDISKGNCSLIITIVTGYFKYQEFRDTSTSFWMTQPHHTELKRADMRYIDKMLESI